ncbi:NEDD8-conjugating enzyme UBC12 [Dictyocoela muelleri]|nr:NEDD8-conjugating enzyme UBC12 [Dictyocoela muelleri]
MTDSFSLFRLNHELKNLSLLKIFNLERTSDFIFKLTIDVDQGIYKNRILNFEIHIKDNYPFTGPKVFCNSKIYHPNIYKKCYCLKILRDEWTPSYGLQEVIYNIYFNLIEIDGKDPLNVEAGELFVNDYLEFVRRAKSVKD